MPPDNIKHDFSELQEIIYTIKETVPKKELKRFHLITVENFIHHFGCIKDRRKRELVYQQLSDYLHYIKDFEVMDKYLSIELFNKYIGPITPIYNRYGFVFIPGFSCLGIVVVIVIVLLLALASVWVTMFALLLLVLYILRMEQKNRQRKIYGYNI
ncbi:hypothetical protein [Paraflavisolibacter caeni]|uniref:hypothetical protein n=1 Tax=Paraflavisolibacter caeni TaxID=2982496 RepID=UPI002433FF54|nr:hypothetical protein [Paraflavisolibacter caeni]